MPPYVLAIRKDIWLIIPPLMHKGGSLAVSTKHAAENPLRECTQISSIPW